MSYQARYTGYMEKANVGTSDLPVDLQELIEKFERAKEAWEQEGQPKALLKILVQSDACISAEIFSLYSKEAGKKTEDLSVDKIKMMALKAKALKLKWKLK